MKVQTPINSKHAGNAFPLDPALAAKYPGGVKFDALGFPDFSPHAKKDDDSHTHIVKINVSGNRTYGPGGDFGDANEAAGYPRNTRHPGYTWHHHEDRSTMLLLPRDLHDAIRHTGGVAVIKMFGVQENNDDEQ